MSSWKRLSLRKRLSQVLTRAPQKGPDKSNEIVRYYGVSVEFLHRFWRDVKEGKRAAGVQVFELQEAVEDVEAGAGVQLADFSAFEDEDEDEDTVLVRVPYRREMLEVRKSQIVQKPREEWTIWDVCEFVIMPEVKNSNTFFLDHVQKKHWSKQAYDGAFVSQSRATRFESLMEALQAHFKGSKDLSIEYVWLDIFCVNQPLTNPQDFRGMNAAVAAERKTLLTSGLHEAIAQFDESLIMFDSWLNPHCLTRAWCVWEIYGAAISGKQMNIVFDEAQGGDMIEKLAEKGSSTLMEVLANLDLRKMNCHNKNDLQDITEVVESLPGGFGALKATINDRLRKWILLSLEDEVIQNVDCEAAEAADLLRNAGSVMRLFGHFDVAENYYKRALEIYQQLYGRNNVWVAQTYNNLGIVLKNEGKYQAALEMYEKAQDILKQIQGPNSVLVAQTYNNMGVVFRAQGRYEEALEMYERALEIDKQVHGPNHGDVAATYINMGALLEGQGKYQEALKIYDMALKIFEEVHGPNHALVAKVYVGIGIVFDRQEKFAEALDKFERALDIYKQVHGPSHAKVAQTYNNMGAIFLRQDKSDLALEMFENALGIFKHVHGLSHESVASTMYNLALVHEEDNREKAHELYSQAYEVFLQTYGPDHQSTRDAKEGRDATI